MIFIQGNMRIRESLDVFFVFFSFHNCVSFCRFEHSFSPLNLVICNLELQG